MGISSAADAGTASITAARRFAVQVHKILRLCKKSLQSQKFLRSACQSCAIISMPARSEKHRRNILTALADFKIDEPRRTW